MKLSGSTKTPPVSRPGTMKTVPLTRPASAGGASTSRPAVPLAPPVSEAAKHELLRPASARSLFGFRSSTPRSFATNVTSSASALVQRALNSPGSKAQLTAAQELSLYLRGLDSSSEPAREAYSQCAEHRLIARLLQPLAGGDRPPKDSPLLQAALSCLANLSCIGAPAEHCDAAVAALIARALKANSSMQNQRTALACLVNISQDAKCVQLLRAAQLEPLLNAFSSSHDVSLRAPASKSLRYFRDVPDSTLQICLQSVKLSVSPTDQRNALHGIARFLAALSPDSREAGDVLEATAARDLCVRENFPALALRLLNEHELREGLRTRENSQDEEVAGQRSVLPQLVHACLTNLAALGAVAEVHAAGGTDAMLKALMTHEDKETRSYALTGLSNMVKFPSAAAAIRESDAMTKLTKLAAYANHPNATQQLLFAARIVALVSDPEDSAAALPTGDLASSSHGDASSAGSTGH